MDVNEQQKIFDDMLKCLQDRALDLKSLMCLLREKQKVNTNSKLYVEFHKYFNTVYSYLYNYALIEIFKFFDRGQDCVSLDRLKNFSYQNFDNIFPTEHVDDYAFSFSFADKKTMFDEIKRVRKTIDKTIQKVSTIRNNLGLAHGQRPDYSLLISFSELDEVETAIESIINIYDERRNNRRTAFHESIFKTKSLEELIQSYDKKGGKK